MNDFPAPAKLNLFLHVVGRREDGYHLLQSVFRFIDYCDTLSIDANDSGEVKLARPIPGVSPETDLTVRAAKLLKKVTGCRLGAEIGIEKRIPMGGGLGGGSSDAATTLVALNRLWKLDLSWEELMRLGLSLGADVPVFIFGESAFAEGIGEKLSPILLEPAWYLVLIPPVQIPTPQIFSHPELTRDSKPVKMSDFSIRQRRNDLQQVACILYPVLREYLEWLERFGSPLMTGSGSCVFAEFASEAEACHAYDSLPQGMRGFVARGLDRHPLKDF